MNKSCHNCSFLHERDERIAELSAEASLFLACDAENSNLREILANQALKIAELESALSGKSDVEKVTAQKCTNIASTRFLLSGAQKHGDVIAEEIKREFNL